MFLLLFFMTAIISIIVAICSIIKKSKSHFNNLKDIVCDTDINEPKCLELCNNAYPHHSSHDPVTYYSACLNYCSVGLKNKGNKKYLCDYCKKCALPFSGYNNACQYFSGPFIEKNKCYGVPMSKCKSWASNPECSQ